MEKCTWWEQLDREAQNDVLSKDTTREFRFISDDEWTVMAPGSLEPTYPIKKQSGKRKREAKTYSAGGKSVDADIAKLMKRKKPIYN